MQTRPRRRSLRHPKVLALPPVLPVIVLYRHPPPSQNPIYRKWLYSRRWRDVRPISNYLLSCIDHFSSCDISLLLSGLACKCSAISLYSVLSSHLLTWISLYGSCLCLYNVMNATVSSILSVSPYKFSSGLVGTTYIAPVIGGILGAFWSGTLADKVALRLARANNGIREPQQRLWPLILTGIFFGAGIILWGVGAAEGIHWFGLVLGKWLGRVWHRVWRDICNELRRRLLQGMFTSPIMKHFQLTLSKGN